MTEGRRDTLAPTTEALQALFAAQCANRWSLARTGAVERRAKLIRLAEAVRARRPAIREAIREDFRKHPDERELTEIGPALEEIRFAVHHLDGWMKPRRVPTTIATAGGRSWIRHEPKGVVLILSPWNYPFNLAMVPLTAAVAAGNCVVLRPSDKVPKTARVLHDLVAEVFPPHEAAVVLGGHDVAEALLDMPFDHIFFTGSTSVGRRVMAMAARHLSSVTLELGGKSPALVDETADVPAAAERLAWGKFINAGQTCVSPDYVLVQERIADALAAALRRAIEGFYGTDIAAQLASPSLPSMIDAGAIARIETAVRETVAAGAVALMGGESDPAKRRLTPTLLTRVPRGSAIMRDEIFGPVLPLIVYREFDEAVEIMRSHGKPLAMYIFSRSNANVDRLLAETTSGGVTVNNTILHLANPHLPFGGTGSSGQGNYHGRFGFETFSHARAVYRQWLPPGAKLLYPPYGPGTRRALRFLRLLTG